MVQRIERHAGHGGKQTNIYDLSGLAAKLNELEPEFRNVEDDVKTEGTSVTSRGYKRRPAKAANGKDE